MHKRYMYNYYTGTILARMVDIEIVLPCVTLGVLRCVLFDA